MVPSAFVQGIENVVCIAGTATRNLRDPCYHLEEGFRQHTWSGFWSNLEPGFVKRVRLGFGIFCGGGVSERELANVDDTRRARVSCDTCFLVLKVVLAGSA